LREEKRDYCQLLSVEISYFREDNQGRKYLILIKNIWYWGQDLNLRPSGYESGSLELFPIAKAKVLT